MNNYYLIIDGQKKGPYTETRIQNMWENKHIDPGTECLKEGETDPRPIEDFPEITSPKTVQKPAATASPTAATSASPASATPTSPATATPASPATATPASPATASTPAWKFILILLVGVGIGGLLISQFGGGLFGPGTDATATDATDANATDTNATVPQKGPDTNATVPQKGPDTNATAPKKGPDTNATVPQKGPDTNATVPKKGKAKSKNKK